MLDTPEQLIKLIENSRRPLIVFGKENDDAIAGALALNLFLTKKKKMPTVASPDFSAPTHLGFLRGVADIQPELAHLQKFTIKVDVSKTQLETLSYDVKDGWLAIHLTPKQGIITKNELRTAQSGFKYDLIFTLGAPDLEALGDIFYNNTDLFYRTPVVNIDHRAGNEHFGQLNLVDIAATSTSEIIFKLLEKIGGSEIDEPIATALLTGMIAQTRSFKTPNVTPHTLNMAGRLIDLGADREKIVRHLYRTKSIGTLKLWGQALTNLQTDRATGLVWTTLTRDDFARSGSTEADLKDLIWELIGNSPEAKLILVLFESSDNKNEIHGRLTVEKDFDALELLKTFKPKGNKRAAAFVVANQTLKQAEDAVLAHLRAATAAVQF
ncbi:MAG: hypothetical protein PHD72_03500 [Patescibacteria group bacterium]|nr:hypothetical protein [Patescibacteria group bacterium]